jgi:hypothetical protein
MTLVGGRICDRIWICLGLMLLSGCDDGQQSVNPFLVTKRQRVEQAIAARDREEVEGLVLSAGVEIKNALGDPDSLIMRSVLVPDEPRAGCIQYSLGEGAVERAVVSSDRTTIIYSTRTPGVFERYWAQFCQDRPGADLTDFVNERVLGR